jgi:hypothetical protein
MFIAAAENINHIKRKLSWLRAAVGELAMAESPAGSTAHYVYVCVIAGLLLHCTCCRGSSALGTLAHAGLHVACDMQAAGV